MESTHLSIHFDQPETEATPGPAKVGWILKGKEPKVLFDPPERLRMVEPNREHAKSASRCPAVIGMESRYFQIRCPYDVNLGLKRNKEGKPELVNQAGTKSPIRASKLGQVFHLMSEREWRYKDRPTIQMNMPYLFVSDEPVFITQLEAFLHYRKTPFPGTIFGGRFPIHNWPRGLMWAFEWHDISKPLIINRGDPLFYVMFEATRPERAIQLFEAEKTPELEEYIDAIAGAVNYVDKTFSMFKSAERIRPEKLVIQKQR